MQEMAVVLNPKNPDFPTALLRATQGTGFSRFWAIGDVKILNTPLLGLLCSFLMLLLEARQNNFART